MNLITKPYIILTTTTTIAKLISTTTTIELNRVKGTMLPAKYVSLTQLDSREWCFEIYATHGASLKLLPLETKFKKIFSNTNKSLKTALWGVSMFAGLS